MLPDVSPRAANLLLHATKFTSVLRGANLASLATTPTTPTTQIRCYTKRQFAVKFSVLRRLEFNVLRRVGQVLQLGGKDQATAKLARKDIYIWCCCVQT